MEQGKLNDRQAAFVREYIKDWNATQAYIRAGYSPRGATQSAATLLTNPSIKKLVDEARETVAKKSIITAEEILQGITDLAFPKEGQVVWPRDRLKAMELLGKTQAMFVDRREHSGPGGKPVEVTTKTWLDVMSEESK